MKLLLLIGGALGFCIGLLVSWAGECSGPACLWHACVAAYVSALLLRWWGQSWRNGLLEALRERQSKQEPLNTTLLSKLGKS